MILVGFKKRLEEVEDNLSSSFVITPVSVSHSFRLPVDSVPSAFASPLFNFTSISLISCNE